MKKNGSNNLNNGLTMSYEIEAWKSGTKYVVGIDEVGRGPLAGPVVAAAVVFQPNPSLLQPISGICDSKKIAKTKHQVLTEAIKKSALGWGIGVGEVELINKQGIVQAIKTAMIQALSAITFPEDDQALLLIDGLPFKNKLKTDHSCEFITGGDNKIFSIACASIIAKHYRDQLMKDLALSHPYYGWETNVGYGTTSHRQAIKQHGVCDQHRQLFVRKLI